MVGSRCQGGGRRPRSVEVLGTVRLPGGDQRQTNRSLRLRRRDVPLHTQQVQSQHDADLAGNQFVGGFLQHVLPSGLQEVRYYGWMSSSSKTHIDEVRWLVWLFLGWRFWLASGYAPQQKPIERERVRCAACGGEMKIVDIVNENCRVWWNTVWPTWTADRWIDATEPDGTSPIPAVVHATNAATPRSCPKTAGQIQAGSQADAPGATETLFSRPPDHRGGPTRRLSPTTEPLFIAASKAKLIVRGDPSSAGPLEQRP